MRGRSTTPWRRQTTLVVRALSVVLVLVASLLAVIPPAGATTLLGDGTVEGSSDYNPAGSAEAFSTVATSTGTVATLSVYVDSGSTATTMSAGVYADGGGKPGTLLAQGSLASPVAGAWNTLGIPATTVTTGTTYWIAILAPTGAGILHYRDKGTGGTATLTANQGSNGTLPTTWTTTASFQEGPISAYGSDGGGALGPQISAVQSSAVGASGATITWTTDVPSTSQVHYGTSPSYGSSTTLDSTLVTSHSQNVTGLSSGTLYDFAVVSTGGAGQTTTSANFSFSTTGGLPATVGQWGPAMSWPLVAVHTNLLDNGKLLLWDGWQTPTAAQLWDPGSQTFTPVVNQQGLFCSGMVTLADGRIMVVGGHDQSTGFVEIGINSVNIFNPATNTWSQGANMHFARWYPSATLLADGRVLVVSGQSTPGVFVDTPEVYDPAANTWTLLNNISTSGVREPEYPLSYLLPNGNVLVIAADTGQAYSLNVAAQTFTAVGAPSTIRNGSADMYAPGKILYSGGANISNVANPAQTAAQIIDMTAASPSWQTVSPMAYPRYEHTMVDLPDGTVFAMGGATVASQVTTSDTLQSEIWNPTTSTFTTMASQAEGRIYHSTAVLMPDGRVLVAGGGRYNSAVDHLSAQYFSPPYLFGGARPTITSAPATGGYGATVTVQTPSAATIGSVSLIDLATDTHTTDMSQRRVPLGFTAGSGSLSVTMPTSSQVAPPGYYMMFITNTSGVPSTAAIIQLTGSGGGVGDTTPPVVSMTAPAGGATVSGSAVTVSASATDNVAVGSVQFLLDGSVLGSAVTASPYQISWDSTKVANGSHQLSALATDTSGNKATSAVVAVTVSNTVSPPPPGLAVDAQVSVHAKGPVTTAPFSTKAAGDWLVAFGSSDGPGPGQSLTVSGAGLTWSLVKRANAQGGTAEVWAAPAPSVLSGVTVTATQASAGYDEDLTVVAYSGSSGVGASASASAPSGAPSVSLTTTAAGSLVAGAGTDWDHATARTFGAGQGALDSWVDTSSGDTFWSQTTSAAVAATATAVTINDTAPTADRWNLAAVEIVAKPSGAQVVLVSLVTPLAPPASPAFVPASSRPGSTALRSRVVTSALKTGVARVVGKRLVLSCPLGASKTASGGLSLGGTGRSTKPGRSQSATNAGRKSLAVGADATLGAPLPYAADTRRGSRGHRSRKSSLWPTQATMPVRLGLDPLTRRSLHL